MESVSNRRNDCGGLLVKVGEFFKGRSVEGGNVEMGEVGVGLISENQGVAKRRKVWERRVERFLGALTMLLTGAVVGSAIAVPDRVFKDGGVGYVILVGVMQGLIAGLIIKDIVAKWTYFFCALVLMMTGIVGMFLYT